MEGSSTDDDAAVADTVPAPVTAPVPKLGLWISGLFLAALGIVAIGCVIWPEVFYDGFVWKYFWGPIVADATDREVGGISEGYNPVSTIVYGLILALAVGAIFLVLDRFQINIDLRFTLAVLPFLLVGVVGRVLEDMELFGEPYVYLFISPLIYIVVGLSTLGALVWSAWTAGKSSRRGVSKTLLLGSVPMWVFAGVYTLAYMITNDRFALILHPVVPAGLAAMVTGLWFWYSGSRDQGEVDSVILFGGTGAMVLGMGLCTLAAWPGADRWRSVYLAANPNDVIQAEYAGFAGVILLAAALTFMFNMVMKHFGKTRPGLTAFTTGVSTLLVFGHMLDASATFVAIDFFGYWEKHVLPRFMIEVTGSAVVMIPMKFLVVGLVIYILDVAFKDDTELNPRLVGLVKIAVLVLGMAPGCRDVLRLGLGV